MATSGVCPASIICTLSTVSLLHTISSLQCKQTHTDASHRGLQVDGAWTPGSKQSVHCQRQGVSTLSCGEGSCRMLTSLTVLHIEPGSNNIYSMWRAANDRLRSAGYIQAPRWP